MPCIYLRIRFLISRSNWKITLGMILSKIFPFHTPSLVYMAENSGVSANTISILLYFFFEYQHCRLLTGGAGKALNKTNYQLSVMVCCVRCLTSCLLATGHLVVMELTTLLRSQQNTWTWEAIAPYHLIKSVKQRFWV